MKLIDTHCHLNDEKLLSQLDQVLINTKQANVEKIIVPSLSLADAEAVVDLIKRPSLFGLVGIHPENLLETAMIGRTIDQLEVLLTKPKVVGIGEIGLDFHHDQEKRTRIQQVELFGRQLQLALDYRLPVAIHMRDAQTEMLGILADFRQLPSGQFHCFAGDQMFLEKVLDWGFYVSFCGNVTYKSAANLRERAVQTPLERLLLETDAPYLAPEGRRGQVNTPANVKITAEFIAQLKELPLNRLAEQTSRNAEQLYHLHDEVNPPSNT